MNNRQRSILLYLVSAEGPLTSDYLAQQLGVSSRTIKSDMASLAAELQNNGAELVSRRNRGYNIQILDDERFQSFYSLASMKVGRTSSYGEGARMLYIARKLVASPNGILLDELAEELYLSRGALRIPLRDAVKFCESFHLQVVSIPGQGLQVTVEEHLLRLAATELFEMHFHTMELDQVDEAYAQWVKCDYQERQDIRHAFLAVLRETPFSLLDMATQRIARYLIIARNRCRAGLSIHLTAPWLRELHTTPIYQAADSIYRALAQRFDD
ncbi:MAG: HTH domain-containing protein, partial [Oscillospiraceae bacterium]|nr:HTH domain-containing protein [Oscillospiraceae bacterium]